MRKLLLALALALPLFGGQSLRLTTGDTMSFTPSETATWQAIGTMRVELAVDINTCSSETTLFKLGNWRVRCNGTNLVHGTNADDGNLSITGKTQILIRMQRDTTQSLASSNGTLGAHLEVWSSDGTGRVAQKRNDNSTAIDASSAQNYLVGTSDIEFHWIKVYSTLAEVGANAPLPDPHGTGDLANWDFEGVLTDSGPDGMTFSTSGTAYTTTPALDPVADPTVDADPFWMQQPSVRAGEEVTLSAERSISFDDVDGVTCVWSDQGGGSGPTAILFTGSTTDCTTTAVFPTFGSYALRLVVTDDGALTGTTDIEVGAVATDSNRIVVMDDDAFAFALGENIQWGKSVWPFLPERMYTMADYFTDNRIAAGWRDVEVGLTVSVTNGDATVTGAGGNDFQTKYCSGGTTPADSGARFTIRDDNGDYWINQISSCTDATHLELANNWNKASDSGLAYSYWTSANQFDWSNGSENENYYDNVWAYYALWKTSGFSWVRDSARDLAEKWWEMPFILKGQSFVGPMGNNGVKAQPRLHSLIGIMLWAKDLGTEATVFPGIEDSIEFFDGPWITHPTSYCATSDPREAWYVGMWLSLARELDTDPTRIANYESILSAAQDASAGPSGGDLDPDICRFPNGGWTSAGINTPPHTTNARTGTVSVVNGDDTITCESTCGWTSDDVGKYAHIGVVSSTDKITDRGQYLITAQDSSTLTISPNFAGTTGSGRWIAIRRTNTYIHQGLANAMPNLALGWQYKGGFSDYRQAMVETFDYVEDKVYWADRKGLYNMTDEEGGCSLSIAAGTLSSDGDNCQFDPATLTSARRYLNTEIVSMMVNGVKYGRQIDDANTAHRVALMDEMMSAAWGGLKGPGTDTEWADEFSSSTTFTGSGSGNGKQKNFGFCCGVGGSTQWDAERLGGLAPEDLVDYGIPLDIAGVSGATKASVTLYEPRGFSRVVNNQTGSSASVTGDSRQGDHLAKIEYKDAMDAVLQTDFVMASEAVVEPAVLLEGSFSVTGSFTIQ